MDYLRAFITGGIICAVGQILIDKTKLTPARILVTYVVLGVLLTAVGIYDKVVQWGGAGATIPILGFGYTMANGIKEEVAQKGLLGIFTGGVTATAAGIASVIFFSFIAALVSRSSDRS